MNWCKATGHALFAPLSISVVGQASRLSQSRTSVGEEALRHSFPVTVLALRHPLLAPLCHLLKLVKSITSRVAVRACLSASTLILAKEAMRDSFTASPAT